MKRISCETGQLKTKASDQTNSFIVLFCLELSFLKHKFARDSDKDILWAMFPENLDDGTHKAT